MTRRVRNYEGTPNDTRRPPLRKNTGCEAGADMFVVSWTAVGGLAGGCGTLGLPMSTDHVWLCGHKVRLHLPGGWNGPCPLANLEPASAVFPENNVTDHKTDTRTRHKGETADTTH